MRLRLVGSAMDVVVGREASARCACRLGFGLFKERTWFRIVGKSRPKARPAGVFRGSELRRWKRRSRRNSTRPEVPLIGRFRKDAKLFYPPAEQPARGRRRC